MPGKQSNLTRTLNRKAAGGLAVTFALSFVNLAGAFLALSMLGGLEPWTKSQFVGFFGLIEAGLGLGFVFAPNVWRLPVAEANTSSRTAIRLAASTVFIPHWLAFAKVFGGAVMLVYAGAAEGVTLASFGVVVEVLLIAVAFLAIVTATARIGVAYPSMDVFFVTIRRPGNKAHELPGLTISGIIIQTLANIGVFPAVQLTEPSAFYRPELGPSLGTLAATFAIAAVFTGIALAAWYGRITWRAPRSQQKEAEAELSATPA